MFIVRFSFCLIFSFFPSHILLVAVLCLSASFQEQFWGDSWCAHPTGLMVNESGMVNESLKVVQIGESNVNNWSTYEAQQLVLC